MTYFHGNITTAALKWSCFVKLWVLRSSASSCWQIFAEQESVCMCVNLYPTTCSARVNIGLCVQWVNSAGPVDSIWDLFGLRGSSRLPGRPHERVTEWKRAGERAEISCELFISAVWMFRQPAWMWTACWLLTDPQNSENISKMAALQSYSVTEGCKLWYFTAGILNNGLL